MQAKRPQSGWWVSYFSFLTALILLSLLQPWPLRAEPYAEISAPLLNHMMKEDERLVLIHVLSEIEYDMHHIAGSVNIPIDKLLSSDKLPTDKSTPLVFYCMGHR